VQKQRLLEQILASLDAELEGYARSARSAHEEATHEQSKAENKYDTRGLEASYLARGQSRQAAETQQARELFVKMALREFSPGEPVDLGALVEVEGDSGRAVYFVGPRAGGMEIQLGGEEVLVITPQSPLGQQLVGKRKGEEVQLQLGGRRTSHRIVKVA
jgi:transcription elongation GreA/GreB family factor